MSSTEPAFDSPTLSSTSQGRVRVRRREAIEKVPLPFAHNSFEFGIFEDKNSPRRRKMEDSHCAVYDFNNVHDQGFFAVFDGHGGKGAAVWCGSNVSKLLSEEMNEQQALPIPEIFDRTFQKADLQLVESGIYSGSTVACALIRQEVRDTRQQVHPHILSLLFRSGLADNYRGYCIREGKAIRLTYDHKASDPSEQSRVRDAGGFISNDRVNGLLAITRSLGDSEMKPFVSARPFTSEVILNDLDTTLIIACDGLWDVCTDQEACDQIAQVHNPADAAELLVHYAIENCSMDNLTVIVVNLQRG